MKWDLQTSAAMGDLPGLNAPVGPMQFCLAVNHKYFIRGISESTSRTLYTHLKVKELCATEDFLLIWILSPLPSTSKARRHDYWVPTSSTEIQRPWPSLGKPLWVCWYMWWWAGCKKDDKLHNKEIFGSNSMLRLSNNTYFNMPLRLLFSMVCIVSWMYMEMVPDCKTHRRPCSPVTT